MAKAMCGVVENETPCPSPARKLGWCSKHYSRWRSNGDPATIRVRPAGVLHRLLRDAIATETDECLILPPKKGRPTARVAGQSMNASRAVWVLAKGNPGDASVLHTCNRGDEGCINLRHLYLGDQARNMRDMAMAGNSQRGRADVRGEANGRAKLTEKQAEEIRRQYKAGGVRQADLAEQYGVSQATISSIVRGEQWTAEGERRRTASDRRRRPTPDQVAAVREAWQQGGVSQQALADRFGFSQPTISKIARGLR